MLKKIMKKHLNKLYQFIKREDFKTSFIYSVIHDELQEEIFYLLRNDKTELAVTNQAILYIVENESMRKEIQRYPFSEYILQKIEIEFANELDDDNEIRFKLRHIPSLEKIESTPRHLLAGKDIHNEDQVDFDLLIHKEYDTEFKYLFKSLQAIAEKQASNLERKKYTLSSMQQAMTNLQSLPSEKPIDLKDVGNFIEQQLTRLYSNYSNRDFKEILNTFDLKMITHNEVI